jgi:exopolysaccharide biosynthesis polyprenyl glycosylphosphotransferase
MHIIFGTIIEQIFKLRQILDFEKVEQVTQEARPGDDGMEETLGFVPVLKGSDVLSKTIKRSRFSPYRFLLLAIDVLSITAGFSLAAYMTGLGFFVMGDLRQYLILTTITLIPLSFFPTLHLYSYHQIFFQKNHIKGLSKAFILSMLSILIILFIYANPLVLSGKTAFLWIIIIAFSIMIISRFLWNHLLTLVRSVGVSFLAIGIIASLSPDERPLIMSQLSTIPIGIGLAAGFVFIARSFVVQVVFNKWMRRTFREQIAIVGSDEGAEKITSYIIKRNAPFYVRGIICGEETECLDSIVPKSRLGELKDIPRIVEENEINEIIITDGKINPRVLIALLDYCTSAGVTVWFPPEILPIIEMKLYIDDFCGLPMIRLCSQKNIWLFSKAKHCLDAAIALPLFVLLIPFFFVMGIIIKWNSKGPVFYKARAIGRDGKEFTMFKFRSMRIEDGNSIHKDFVTKMIKGEINYEGKKDQVFKIIEDPRITSVGKFIRKFSIDELPQILNVLKGDISLVGPRPCLPYEYDVYKDWHKKRMSVRPGITGLWQVAGRSAVTFEDMVLLDLYYIYNRSVMMDLNIMYETIFTVLGKRGAH